MAKDQKQEREPEVDEAAEAARKKAEAAALEAERAATVAAGEAERLKRLGDAPPPRVVSNSQQTFTGDIRVLCLKDNARVAMGMRSYNLQQGKTIEMHPSHARELEQTGWVLARG